MTATIDTTEIDFRSAIILAIAAEMEHDPAVILMGEDVAFAGGVFQATKGLFDQFGPDRVIDTPISELALAGAAFGAAVTGLRPIMEIMFGDFMFLAMDSLVNQSAKHWFLSNEQQSVPLVVRSAVGGGGRFGAIHSQVPVPWLLGIPGIKLLAPSRPSDAYWLLRDAIRDENPVVFFEHKRMYAVKGPLAESGPPGGSQVLRPGRDVTLVGCMATVPTCVEAAEQLSSTGIEAEVVDLFSLNPLDVLGVAQSVQSTGALVAVEEGPASGGWSSALLAGIVETCETTAIRRVTSPAIPLPFSAPLEDAWMPSVQDVIDGALAALERRKGHAS